MSVNAHTLTPTCERVSASLSVSPGLCGRNRNYSGVGGKTERARERERENQTTQDAEIVTGTDCEHGLFADLHAVLDPASGWMCLQSVESFNAQLWSLKLPYMEPTLSVNPDGVSTCTGTFVWISVLV